MFGIPRLSWIIASFLGALLVVQTVRIEGLKIWPLKIDGFRSELFDAKAAAVTCQNLRFAEHEAYRATQAEAAAKNKAHVAQIEKQQQEANNEVTSNLHSRIEQLRRELRDKARPTAQGSAGGSGLPQAGGEPGTAPAPGVCLTPEEHVSAAESEERHDQLITLIERLTKN
jgi:hypothetical protein